MLALNQVLENLGRMFDHFLDFDMLVEDGAPRRSGDHGISPPFAGFLWDYGLCNRYGMSAHGFAHV
jgi:hypothetical protein